MKLKGIVQEDFSNYKEPSMFLSTCYCDWKCCLEQGFDTSVCQNYGLNNACIQEIDDNAIIKAYMNNPITKAIVFGGLEPYQQLTEIIEFIEKFRKVSNDYVIIYTGFNEEEHQGKELVKKLVPLKNIIIKFGRYIPNQHPHLDSVLGVGLASDNQYAKILLD